MYRIREPRFTFSFLSLQSIHIIDIRQEASVGWDAGETGFRFLPTYYICIYTPNPKIYISIKIYEHPFFNFRLIKRLDTRKN